MEYAEWANDYEQTADRLAEMVHRIEHFDVPNSCKSLIAAKIHRDRKLIRQCRRVAAELRKRESFNEP